MVDPDITMQYANLTLADIDDEEVAMQILNVLVDQRADEQVFYVVGRLFTKRPIKFQIFQDTMAGFWTPRMGVTMSQLQPHRFLIRFYHDADITRIMNDGPWSSEQRFRSEAIVTAIGSFLGSFEKSDEKNFDGSMHTYYRAPLLIL
nr:uncharacterized protein LOC109174935 [Ipomoea batatas]